MGLEVRTGKKKQPLRHKKNCREEETGKQNATSDQNEEASMLDQYGMKMSDTLIATPIDTIELANMAPE